MYGHSDSVVLFVHRPFDLVQFVYRYRLDPGLRGAHTLIVA